MKQAGLEINIPGCIIFWLGPESTINSHPGEPYAMDTKRELGEFIAFVKMMNVRMVVGGKRNFHGLDVTFFELCVTFGVQFMLNRSLEDVARQAILTARQ